MYKTIERYELEPEQIIFKHSKTCGTSARGKSIMDKIARSHDVILVVVQDERDISNEIAEKLGIEHESPQLIIVKHGRVAAVLNHWHISEAAISAVLAAEHSH